MEYDPGSGFSRPVLPIVYRPTKTSSSHQTQAICTTYCNFLPSHSHFWWFSRRSEESREIVYSLTNIEGFTQRSSVEIPAKPPKRRLAAMVYYPTRDGVLPSKLWCTPQQVMVYWLTRNGVLPSKFWCTPQQKIVYSPTSWQTYFTCKHRVCECSKPRSLLLLFILLFYIDKTTGEKTG